MRACVSILSLLLAGCGGNASATGEIPRPKGEGVPQAAVNAESAGSEPVPTSFRASAPGVPTGRPTPPPMKMPKTAPPTATPM